MPNYIIKQHLHSRNTGCETSYCKDSAIFFNDLATKLLEMASAIDTRIEEIQKNCHNSGSGKGVYFASVEVVPMTVGIKYEYIEYIKIYGPPTDGVFDETKLQQLRVKLGIDTKSSTAL
jgi:hypothetical protein